ncbi:signal peptidase II [Oleidesulfovibrio sp.]|uniref:signal peptidase II n=1 Tax=Oleidesulfovibrio sp. TaxID=2909707 RepID=UPI003A8A97EE
MRPRFFAVYSIAALVIAIDQWTKLWAASNIPPFIGYNVIPGFFDLVNVRNRGAAFGFLNRSDIEWQFWLFFAAALTAVIAIILMTRSAKSNKYLFTGFGLIMGGAIGNLIDRIRIRAVIDFLDFYIGDYHWPAFNVADIGICLGAMFVCLAVYKQK